MKSEERKLLTYVLCPEVKGREELVGAAYRTKCSGCKTDVYCSVDGQSKIHRGALPICRACVEKLPKHNAAFLPSDERDWPKLKELLGEGVFGEGALDIYSATYREAQRIGIGISSINGPEQARTAIMIAMAHLLTEISDSQWGLVLDRAHDPCGRPMCDCEKMTGPLIEALDKFRSYAKTVREREEV